MKNNIYDEIIEDMYASTKLIKSMFMKIAEKNRDIKLIHSNHFILEILLKNGAVSMTELGEDMGISKPNLTVIIDHLIEEKLVKRVYDEKDRRIIRIKITPSGEKILKDTKNMIKKEFIKLLASLNQNEIDTLSESIKNMKNIIIKINASQKISK